MPETVTFDHYEVLTRDDGSLYELGRGAMGITYKAFDTNLRIPVALKVINATFLHSEVARQRFIREARSAAKLRHRNVASVFHLGTDSDAYFYAMEFIDGETVEALIKRQGPLTPLVALQITAQVARALNAAQPHGLVHRDIKPANLMLVREDDDLAVKVIDFGLAKSSHPAEGEDESTTVSMAGFVGTPHFASPEQLDEKEIDVRSDIYSLGVTLWYMLAGQAPFSGSMAQVMSQHLSKPPPFEKLSNIPAALAKLLGRMLEKDPARRPQTAAELRREIDECLEQLRAGGHPGEATVDSGQDFATIFDATAAGEKAGTRFKTGALIAGRYRIIGDLGETNTGHLFHAQQVSPERGVRLLVLNREIVEDAAAYTKIEKDVQRVAAATHRNLLQTYAIETVDYESFVVSEWTDGFSLLELLRARRELSASEALLLLPQAADGIDHAARLGLRRVELALHQVFVHFPQAGLAKEDLLRRPVAQWPPFALKLNPLTITRDLSASETWAGRQTIVSGLQAAPPEGDETSRTIQSLAAVVYELLGGTLSPFALKGGGTHRYTPIATLSEAGNDILRRALEPRSGFSTARDFYAALSGIGGLEVERYETRPPPVPAVRTAPRPRIAPPVAASKATPPRRKVPMKFFGGVLTIAAIGAAMYFFAQQASKKREQPSKSAATAPPKTKNTVATTTTPPLPIEPPPVVVPLPEPLPVPPVAPPTPTRQELLKTAVAEANEFERKKDWPHAIEAWLRIAEDYPEGTGKTRLEMLFDDFFEKTSEKKAACGN
jgi:serine/threonine protein kinase